MKHRPRLEIQGLTCRHVGPLDLSLASRECVTLSGPSGAGKTLLLRALADLDPWGGRVLLDGVECRDMQPHQWRRRVGMLPAESAWWGDTVREHFETPGEAETERLGFGPEVMDWAVSRLSTGERQRLALLRLLGIAPRTLLLDEPTANLDADGALRVERLLSDYLALHDACCLWITHDPEQASRVSTRHFVLSGGMLRKARGPGGKETASWA